MEFVWDYPGELVPEVQNQSGFYWSKRQWVAVASAGPYAKLHLVCTMPAPTTQYINKLKLIHVNNGMEVARCGSMVKGEQLLIWECEYKILSCRYCCVLCTDIHCCYVVC